MEPHLYPWGGEYVTGDPCSPVAVVTLSEELDLPREKVAIHGKMKTENLGIEKVIANVISNPNIRFVVVFGEDIRGHRSGGSLIALHRHGLDEKRRIMNAPGAVPYIENLNEEAIRRFRDQVEMVDLVGETDLRLLEERLDELFRIGPTSYGEPYLAIRFRRETGSGCPPAMDQSIALHRTLILTPFLEVMAIDQREANSGGHGSGSGSTNRREEPAD